MGKELSGKIRLRSSNGLNRDYYAHFLANEEIGGSSGGSNTPADAGSVNYSDTGSYSNGSVGAKLSELSQKVGEFSDERTNSVTESIEAVEESVEIVAETLDNKVSFDKNIPAPTRLIRIDVTLNEGQTLPTTKNETTPILAYGKVKVNFDGITLNKYCTLEVQGASSASLAKKNYTIGFFSDAEYKDSYKFRINNMVEHDEYIFKANYIDITQSRNVVCARIWEQMVQCREGFPKRETEFGFDATETTFNKRFDTGALGHTDGYPCVLYVDGTFYGIGTFIIGKKVKNYNLEKNVQTHIMMTSDDHNNLYSYTPTTWEVKAPKTPDAEFTNRIKPWFDTNALTGDAFKTRFSENHNLKNMIDYYLHISFCGAGDNSDKNFVMISSDGVHFNLMPWDLDTSFGLFWTGGKHTEPTLDVFTFAKNATSRDFWTKFENAFMPEIKARYKVLRDNGVFTEENVYQHFVSFGKVFGEDNYKLETNKWAGIPSNSGSGIVSPWANRTNNSGCYDSIPFISSWTTSRLVYLDSLFGYSNENGMRESNTLSIGLIDNTKYKLGTVSSVDISNIPTDNSEGILIYFTAAEGCTLTYDEGTKWYGGEAPTIETGSSYVIMICDGICGCKSY